MEKINVRTEVCPQGWDATILTVRVADVTQKRKFQEVLDGLLRSYHSVRPVMGTTGMLLGIPSGEIYCISPQYLEVDETGQYDCMIEINYPDDQKDRTFIRDLTTAMGETA